MTYRPGLVSIIMVNWNTRDLLLQCIESIEERLRDVPHEVVVIDNASEDGSAEAVRASSPDVTLIPSAANLGFALGNNVAVQSSAGEFLLFLNPDTVVQEGAVQAMREFLTEDESAGLVGCRILGADGSVQTSCWDGFPSLGWCWRAAFYLNKPPRAAHGLDGPTGGKPIPVSHLLGACMMIRRDLFDELGGFDESYFLYMEETDLCYRAIQAGRRNYYLPKASIVHLGQQSTNQAADWTNTQLQMSTYAFIRRTGSASASTRAGLQLAMASGCLVRLALWTLRLLRGRPERGRCLKMLKGYGRLLFAIRRFETAFQRDFSPARNT